MKLTFEVLEITAPVFFLTAIGFAWIRLGFEYRVEFVTRLAMTLAVPALVFVALMETEIPAQSLSLIGMASIVSYIAVTCAVWLLIKITNLDIRTYLAPISMGNTGNIGLPIALFAFGDKGFGYAVVVFAASSIYAYTFGIWVVARSNSPFSVLKEPMIAATVLGTLFMWQGWETPKVVTSALSLVGQMAIPIMLITLGVAVARLTPKNLARSFWIALAKVVLCTSIAWGVALFFNLPHIAFEILVLQLSAPAAVTSYLIAEKYKADAQAVASLVVASTVLAVLTFPVLLVLLL